MQRGARTVYSIILLTATVPSVASLRLQAQSSTSSSSSQKHGKKPAASSSAELDAGSAGNDVYRNRTLEFTIKIPEGWVLRTEEMNARDEQTVPAEGSCPHGCSTVLLAAFSRPPEAKGEDINSSILIAAEQAEAYPGMKDAAQYFGPLTEVATAQGFDMDEDPYEFAVGSKTLVRGDFHKDVGSRVMRQSTLAMLSHGYVVSITVIGGTEDEVEELIDGLEFQAPGKQGSSRAPK